MLKYLSDSICMSSCSTAKSDSIDMIVFSQKAIELLEKCISGFDSKHDITFLTGAAGPLALAAVMLHSQHKEEQAKQLILKYIDFPHLHIF